MGKAFLVLHTDELRAKAIRWIQLARQDSRVTFQSPKRTLPQNDRMWAMLTDVADQKEHFGQKMPPEDWKDLFMHALGRETRYLPALDGRGFVPIGYRSSELGIDDMSQLIELMFAWGVQNGVRFLEPGDERPTRRRKTKS